MQLNELANRMAHRFSKSSGCSGPAWLIPPQSTTALSPSSTSVRKAVSAVVSISMLANLDSSLLRSHGAHMFDHSWFSNVAAA